MADKERAEKEEKSRPPSACAGAPSPRRWQLEEEVAIARGPALLVEFTEDTGLIRRD